MNTNVNKELASLDRMTTGELAQRYAELSEQPVRTRHRAYLIRKIAWRLQANAEGDLSERARQRAAELADDAEIRVMPPRSPGLAPKPARGQQVATVAISSDQRLPSPGTAITRPYKGRTLLVTVLAKGFEFEGERYKTLSAVAKAITGTHVNGYHFFRLGAPR